MLIEVLHQSVEALAQRVPLRVLVQRQARLAFVANRDQNLFFGVCASWDEAVAAAQRFGAAGYMNPLSAPMSLALAKTDWCR